MHLRVRDSAGRLNPSSTQDARCSACLTQHNVCVMQCNKWKPLLLVRVFTCMVQQQHCANFSRCAALLRCCAPCVGGEDLLSVGLICMLYLSQVVDVGSGRGYLGTQLSLKYQLPVLGVDSSQVRNPLHPSPTPTTSGLVRTKRNCFCT